ncbi:hypothetical protein ACWFRK_30170 [Streptomyces sp. NPDC055157]
MARRNTRIRLARAQDTAVANALLGTAGVQIIRALRSAIEDGTAGSALLAGLGGTTKIFYTAAATDRPPMRPGATPTPHALRAARLRPNRGHSISGTGQQLDDVEVAVGDAANVGLAAAADEEAAATVGTELVDGDGRAHVPTVPPAPWRCHCSLRYRTPRA